MKNMSFFSNKQGLLNLGVVLICIALLKTSLMAQSISCTNSWVGNTGGKHTDHIMHNLENMYVRPDGAVYGITSWEEGGSNVSVFKNGQLIAVPENSGTGGWGRMSGSAVTSDNTYIYQALSQHGCDGGTSGNNSNGLPKFPACNSGNGPVWKVIARYTQTGLLAPFQQGYGFKGAFLMISENGKMPNGLAVYNNELFVSDPTNDTIKVYNTSNLTTIPIRKFKVPRVGLLSPDNQGGMWMLQPEDANNPAKIIRFAMSDGALLPQQIIFPEGVKPTAFQFDIKHSRILVTDNGINQNIRIYSDVYTGPTLSSTFGIQYGMLSGIPGEVGPLKFSNPMGIGADTSGNIYVANTGLLNGASRGAQIQSYKEDGTLNWTLNGLIFTANADVDRTSETDVYTFDRHLKMDYSKITPGTEWSYKGYTLNSFKYPEDARMQDIFFTSALVRNIQGNRILYTSDMYGGFLGVYRFNQATDGEIAIPCGLFTSAKIGAGWPAGHDMDKEFVWLDQNSDGKFQADEYDYHTVDNDYAMAWSVDENGGVWKGVREKGLRYFPMQGFDQNGAPVYSYATSVKYDLPEGTNGVKRIYYDAKNDALYLAGFSNTVPDVGDTWWCMGSTLCKYSNWMAGNRKPTWTLYLPFNPSSDILDNAKSFTVEGSYVFVAMARMGKIYVYNMHDKTQVGIITPGTPTGRESGWTDINIAVTAMKRYNGQYLVFMEENGNGKVMMYRWCPSGNCSDNCTVKVDR